MIHFLGGLFAQDAKIQKILELAEENQEAIQAIQKHLTDHTEAAGVPLQWVVAVGSLLISAIAWLAVNYILQQKRGDKFSSEIRSLLEGKIMTLVTTLQEFNRIASDLTRVIESQKEALYKLRDNQTVMKEKFTETLLIMEKKLEVINATRTELLNSLSVVVKKLDRLLERP